MFKLTLQFLGHEQTDFGANEGGRQEIINVCFDLAEWNSEENKSKHLGLTKVRFGIKLPGWLPPSQFHVSDESEHKSNLGLVRAQVKYHLIAQLFVTGPNCEEFMIGWLPELGISQIRHEL